MRFGRVMAIACVAVAVCALAACASDGQEPAPSPDAAPAASGAASTHVSYGLGVLVSADEGSLRATVRLDGDTAQAHAGETVTFDFSRHTEWLPVEIGSLSPGEQVYVRYFDAEQQDGSLAGESLEHYAGQFPFGSEEPV